MGVLYYSYHDTGWNVSLGWVSYVVRSLCIIIKINEEPEKLYLGEFNNA